MGKKVMMIAGELSGDLHGAHLAKALWRMDADIHIYGIGGPRMRSLNIPLIYDSTSWGAVGLTGVLKKAFLLRGAFKDTVKKIGEDKPDALVLIDFGAFNVRLARAIESLDIPILYYFPPGAWCPTPEKAEGVARYVSKVAATFPGSARAFQEIGADVEYVGHPLIDIVKPGQSADDVLQELSLNPQIPVVGLFPGSREEEVRLLLPVMLKAALKIEEQIGQVQYLIPVASSAVKPTIERIMARYPEVPVGLTEKPSYDIMQICKVLIVGAGTATLEAACLGVPMVVLGKIPYIDYLFLLLKEGKRRPEFFALPNMIMEKKVVPELIQDQVQVHRVVEETMRLLEDTSARECMVQELLGVLSAMGQPGVVDRVAGMVMSLFN
jgi:lipid-A-disaccharide synthase